jgi:hypothetical protein
LSAIIADCNDQFLAITQGVDPAFATGRMQDGIARIYFISRLPAQPTVVQATCSGQVNAIIPASALAQTPDGNLWAPVTSGQFGLDGTVSMQFVCTVTGPVACPAGSLTTIYKGVPGWDTITNPTEGVLGRDVETAPQFELRRQQLVFLNSVGGVPAVQAAVLNVPGILDAYTTDNASGGVVVSDGVTIPANGLYVCAAGGSPAGGTHWFNGTCIPLLCRHRIAWHVGQHYHHQAWLDRRSVRDIRRINRRHGDDRYVDLSGGHRRRPDDQERQPRRECGDCVVRLRLGWHRNL